MSARAKQVHLLFKRAVPLLADYGRNERRKKLGGIRKKQYLCTVNIMFCKHYANMTTLIINKI